MAKQKQTRLPNVLRNPLLMTQVTEWMRDQLEVFEKGEAEAGRAQRSRRKVALIKAAIAEIERNADDKIGDQLDGVL
jgi:hypothetical protein